MRLIDASMLRTSLELDPFGAYRSSSTSLTEANNPCEAYVYQQGRFLLMREKPEELDCAVIATFDQAIFVKRDAFQAAGGFPAIPLMADIALCKHLKRLSRPLCLRERVVLPGRRWEMNGVGRMALMMWRLRLAYFFGTGPEELAKQYAHAGGKDWPAG